MNNEQPTNPLSSQRLAGFFEDVIQTFVLVPEYQVDKHDLIIIHSNGYCIGDSGKLAALIGFFTSLLQNMTKGEIEEECLKQLGAFIDGRFANDPTVDWDKAIELKNTGRMPSAEYLKAMAETTIAYLSEKIRPHDVFIPIIGLELEVAEYDFGPLKLVRTRDSLPLIEKANSSANFRYVHEDIFQYFATSPCLVRVEVTGSTEFVRQEGLRIARQLAAIINLHRSNRAPRGDFEQKIQCAGIPSSYTRVTLERTFLPDENGQEVATYLHSTANFGVHRQYLNHSQLETIQRQGFDKIWGCFETPTGELQKRVKRAVSWFDKAVNFDEIDAQIVGLATSIDTLLVSNSDRNNLLASWGSITQQLADKCAFLLGHDLQSTKDIVRKVKRLYGFRSAIVHDGAERPQEEAYRARSELAELVSSVILDFVQRDFPSFEQFEQWIITHKYSVNMSEVTNRGD